MSDRTYSSPRYFENKRYVEELLKKSDIITLHLPYEKELYHMLGKKEFDMMKSEVYIINTARGELIDTAILYENLLCGKVKGAAIDVFECEHFTLSQELDAEQLKDSCPKCLTSAYITQKLLGMKNVIITPHVAYNTRESVERLLEVTFNNIRDFSKGMHNNQVC